MTNIHGNKVVKVLIMKVPVGRRFFTSKHPNGMLSSGRNIEDILKESLPREEYERKRREIRELLAPKNCVVYCKSLLDEPELDHFIAATHGYVHRYSIIDACRPDIIHFVRDRKKKPATEANINGYHHIINMFFSRRLPIDLRFKAYEIFNKALDVDKRNKTNTFLAALHLCWWNLSEINIYRKLIDKLWMDPEFIPGQSFDWGHFFTASNGTKGNFKSTPHYNDSRFIEIVNQLYNESKAARLPNIVKEHGEHAPRFRKTG